MDFMSPGWIFDFGLLDTDSALGILASIIHLVGKVAGLVGWVWLLKNAFADDTTWGILCLLCGPLGGLVFLFKSWDEAKKPYALMILGWIVSALGVVLYVVAAVHGARGGLEDDPGGLASGAPRPVTSVERWLNVDESEVAAWTDAQATGREVLFDKLRGRVVVVEFWASWCPPCAQSVERLNRLHQANAASGLLILGLTVEDDGQDDEDIDAFVAERIKYPVGVLANPDTLMTYEVHGIPFAVVVGRDGQTTWAGNPLDDAFEAAVATAVAAAPPKDAPAVAATPTPGTTPRTTEAATPTFAPLDPDPPPLDWNDEAVILERAASQDAEARANAVRQWAERVKDRAPGARTRMLKALARPLDAEVMTLLVRSIDASPPEADEALECLAYVDGEPRRALIRGLGRRELQPGTLEQVAAALARLQDPDRDALVDETLVRLGRPREGSLTRLLRVRGAEWARGEGLELLRRLPPVKLGELVHAQEVDARALACRLLAEAPPAEARPVLQVLLHDADRSIRQQAIEVLARDPDSAPLLARLLVDEDESARAFVLKALDALPEAQATQALSALARSADAADRRGALVGLTALSRPEGVTVAVALLADPERAVRLDAARALSALQQERQNGLQQAVAARADDIGEAARETQDQELRRALRHLYFTIRGRLPEQDAPR